MRPPAFFSHLLFVCLLGGCLCCRSLAQFPNKSDYTNGLPGPVNLPGATLGILDRSVMSSSVPTISDSVRSLSPFDSLAVERSNFELTLQLPGFLYALQKAVSRMPPEAALYIGEETRFGSASPVYAPNLYFSSLTGCFDASVQGFFTEQNGKRLDGFGAALRFDLAQGDRKLVRDVLVLKRLHDLTRRALTVFLADSVSPASDAKGFAVEVQNEIMGILGVRNLSEIDGALRKFDIAGDFIGASFSPRYAVFGAYRSFGGAQTDGTLGFSLSRLFPLRGETGSGIMPLLTVQGVEVSPDDQNGVRFGRAAGVRFGMALVWQDRVPHIITRTERNRSGESIRNTVARWRWQTGVEYQFKSSVDNGSNLSLFVRRRDLKNNFDAALLGGVEAHGRVYVGINIGKSFDFTSGGD